MKKLSILIIVVIFAALNSYAQPHWKLLTAGQFPTRCIDTKDGYIYVGVAGNSDHGLIRSNYDGANWSSVSTVFDEQNIYSFAFDGPIRYVGTGDGLYSSFDNGASWNKEVLSTGDFLVYAIATRGNETFIASQTGLQYRPDDETIWKRIGIYDANLSYVTDVVIEGDTVFSCDISYGVAFTTDAGNTWTKLVCPGAKSITKLCHEGGRLFVGTDVGAFYWNRLSDTLVQISSGMPVNSIANQRNDIFIGTYAGVYHSRDFGHNWTLFDADSVVLSAYDLEIRNYVLYAASYYGAYSTDISYLGNSEAGPEVALTVSPNPATDRINISSPVLGRAYSVVNMLGETVTVARATSGEALSIDISGLASGIYFVRDGMGFASKFVKE